MTDPPWSDPPMEFDSSGTLIEPDVRLGRHVASHLLAFLSGAATMLLLMIYDGVYGPVRLRWK